MSSSHLNRPGRDDPLPPSFISHRNPAADGSYWHAWRGRAGGLLALCCLMVGGHVAAHAEDMIDNVLPAHCVAHVMNVPLMSHSGSPVIPVVINGKSGVAYVSFTQEDIGVFAVPTMDYPIGKTFQIQTIAGQSYSFATMIKSLHIAQGEAADVPAIVVGDRQEMIGDQPVLGIIGYSVLSNYDVLLDFVTKRMVLFRMSETASCNTMSQWLGPDATPVTLLSNGRGVQTGVELHVGGVPLRLEVEPGSNASVVRQKDAHALGLTHATLHADPHVRTVVGRILVGHRHHFDNVTIGEWKDRSLDVNVEKAKYNLLGMDFLRNRKVLMAFPQGMLYLTPPSVSKDKDPRIPSALATHLATATVHEASGTTTQ
ncbi:retropepsin-like aspartic protease [Novacetimonas hansenii]|uniref:retropepsin-like aspartic protease n=1 Tax=Novacetimonas hansenii TaxID=436 RepID=UPI00094FE541|nr:retropepsin-like aspartic protease [Novacetimonas hansenii]